jgi:hypothetical protein
MKIYLQDSAFAHSNFSSNPTPPKQFTDKVEWDRSESFTSDDVVVWTDVDIPRSLNRTGPNIAWLVESQPYHSQIYNFVCNNHDKFKAIWTHDKGLINKLPNATWLPCGGCWIDEFDWGVHTKTKDFSIIASSHNYLPGHKMRHQIAAGAEGRIDLFGSGYNPIDDKITGLKDYRYTFCIENNKCDYYFTEKLIDCFVTGTIPIYWGCPSVGDFFNIDGMICFDEIKQLPRLLPACTPEYYESKLDAIKDNYQVAQKFRLAELHIPALLL